jgi:2-polyprenyl-3-methyl-5-hydroxy-6-metoxy-1,4-benzoquinol methylase
MQIIRTLAELDEKLLECDRAARTSDDQLRAVFETFRMDPPDRMPADPFSTEYREFHMDLYRHIAGRDYATANEITNIDVAQALHRPFPYATGSCSTVGDHLIAIGFLFRCLALAPQSRVLELGHGWGNATVLLAETGHRVTTVDIEPGFCELIKRRAAQKNLPITVVNAEFTWVEEVREPFDAVIFFESFHHAADHIRLLRALRQTITSKGRIYFGAEPIQPDFPYPWGIRLDGQSLWTIRKHGCLELGFNDRYFAAALSRNGWFGHKHVAGIPGWLNVWEAQLREAVVFRFAAGDPILGTEVGVRVGDVIALQNARHGTALYGPYITLPTGRYVAQVYFRPGTPRVGRAIMDIAVEIGTRQVTQRVIEVAHLLDSHPVAKLEFASDGELRELEVRLICDPGFTAQIEAVEIRPT